MSSPPDSSKVQSVEPTSSSMEMSDGDPYTFSDDGDHNQTVEASYENDKKSPCAGSPPQSSPLAVEPLTPSSTSSSSAETEINIYKKKSTGGNPPVQNVSKIKLMKFDLKPSKKRKGTGKPNDKAANCRLPAILQQLDDSMHQSKSPKYLLPDKIQDCEDESDAASYCPLPRYVTAYLAAENTRRRNFQLKEKSNEMRRQYLQLTKMMEAEQKYFDRRQNVLTKKLLQAARCCPDETALLLQGRKLTSGSSLTDASSNRHIFTKHKCSFVAKHKEKSDASCSEFALPCSTLCSRHILYSVDQQLFEFCSARTPSGSPPCGAPVLSIHSGLPCCATHTNINNSSKNSGIESTDSSTVNGIGSQSGAGGIGSNKSSRRKARSRSSSLGRHSRRLRNRRRAIKSTETRIHCIEASDNGMELDVETVDSPENCSPAYPTPAQLIPVAVPTAPVGAAAVPSLDHEAEILEDHDLKELLNRLPDEAFQEIFSMTQVASSVSRNGGLFVPSREEAEELERALAEEVPIAIANENDLSDLSLIDDHTLALAHDLVMGAGAVAQNLLLATAETASSTNMFMDHNVLDNLNIPHHPTVTNTGYAADGIGSARRRNVGGGQQVSPARGSSPQVPHLA